MNDSKGKSEQPDEAVISHLLDALQARQPAVLITVIETEGSTPRKPGAKMLVTREGQHGSIGGGAIEKAAVDRARELLASGGEPEMFHAQLAEDLGMGCGGNMNVFLEPIQSTAPRLIIFGAGHVGKALCAMAALAGFDVTVCDSRGEWLTEQRFPSARNLLLAGPETTLKSLHMDSHTYLVIMTHQHALDIDIVRQVLELPEQLRYLGMIGSRRKGEQLIRELTAQGFNRDQLAKVHTPVGLNLGAVTPEEIALAIVAELIAERRGGKDITGW